MNIYIVRYSHNGYADGIRLFTTIKGAKEAAEQCIGWGAWRAIIYKTNQAYNNELDYEEVEIKYNNEPQKE